MKVDRKTLREILKKEISLALSESNTDYDPDRLEREIYSTVDGYLRDPEVISAIRLLESKIETLKGGIDTISSHQSDLDVPFIVSTVLRSRYMPRLYGPIEAMLRGVRGEASRPPQVAKPSAIQEAEKSTPFGSGMKQVKNLDKGEKKIIGHT